MRSAPGRSRQVGTSRRSTAKAWRPSWPPPKTAAPTVVVPWPRFRSLVPIVAGSGHTSPLGPYRAALGETSIRLVTMDTSSADNSPWGPGQHSADDPPGARPPWQTAGGRSSDYRKVVPPVAEWPGRYSTRTL